MSVALADLAMLPDPLAKKEGLVSIVAGSGIEFPRILSPRRIENCEGEPKDWSRLGCGERAGARRASFGLLVSCKNCASRFGFVKKGRMYL